MFPLIQPFGSVVSSSLGKVYSRQATASVNCENYAISFVMKYCPISTTFNNPASIQNLLNLSCGDNFSIRSSHQTRDLERFADKCSIPWNLPTNLHPDLIATTRQRCLLLLCALLFLQPHLFLICVVSTYNDSKKDLHKLCRIPRKSV